ncbi:hypothetical protein Fmac_019049 [Flemingia macrophylla]|uniref:ATP synthase F0 subunit 8 n=1 Tax=Flemingia macrophylla TaxID=520843 RepID=A0ABD1M6P6_9FABA
MVQGVSDQIFDLTNIYLGVWCVLGIWSINWYLTKKKFEIGTLGPSREAKNRKEKFEEKR